MSRPGKNPSRPGGREPQKIEAAYGRFPAWIITSGFWAALPPSARSLLGVLIVRANKQRQVWASNARLAKEAGLHARTIRKAVAHLKKVGIIRQGWATTDRGQFRCFVIVDRPPDDAGGTNSIRRKEIERVMTMLAEEKSIGGPYGPPRVKRKGDDRRSFGGPSRPPKGPFGGPYGPSPLGALPAPPHSPREQEHKTEAEPTDAALRSASPGDAAPLRAASPEVGADEVAREARLKRLHTLFTALGADRDLWEPFARKSRYTEEEIAEVSATLSFTNASTEAPACPIDPSGSSRDGRRLDGDGAAQDECSAGAGP